MRWAESLTDRPRCGLVFLEMENMRSKALAASLFVVGSIFCAEKLALGVRRQSRRCQTCGEKRAVEA